MRLRQVALVAHSLAPAVDQLTALLGIKVAYNDPGVGKFGLENAVMAIGDTFLEVVVPTRPATTAGRLLEKRGGDGGYMVLLQVGDIAVARARLEEFNVRVIEQATGAAYDMSHLHPKDIGGAIVSLDQMTPPEHWEWAGPNWRSTVDTSIATSISGVEIQSDDPEAMGARWAEVLGENVRASGWDHECQIQLADGRIRFVKATDGRGDGVAAFEVEVHRPMTILDRARELGCLGEDGVITVCGTRIYPSVR